ncbi:MAG: hypothetical protein RMJ82_15530, partial [Gemmatales bacterium]|nr:hypothetical protein [Gemmatales bacterium]
GIATDDSTKAFFGDLNERRQLISLYDFENREAIFPGVHRSYKFSLLTMGHTDQPARFVFFATDVSHITDPQRVFTLTPADLALINPNTRTAPVFRTRADAELTRNIYRRAPVLIDERRAARSEGQEGRNDGNPWGVRFMTMFHMANDSHLFHTAPGEGRLPLYEAKLLHQFTHRWATYGGAGSGEWGMGSGRAGVGSGRASVGSVGDDESDVFEQAPAPHRSVELSGRPDSPSPATLEGGGGVRRKSAPNRRAAN